MTWSLSGCLVHICPASPFDTSRGAEPEFYVTSSFDLPNAFPGNINYKYGIYSLKGCVGFQEFVSTELLLYVMYL